jgi:hypothetical protein
VDNKGQNGSPDLNAIRMMLAELATGQARHEHFMQQHEEWLREHDKGMREIQLIMTETRKDLAAAAKHLRSHARAIEQIDGNLDRATRKLEVHGDLIADLFQTKADRKKRSPRK